MTVSVVIPVYGQGELTRQCLQSLAATTADVPDVEILVVDNGAGLSPSQNAACADLGRALFGDRFHYLPQSVNLNFSGACNLGARAATGRYLCLLNNDTTHEPGWLACLLNALQADATLDAVGPLLLYPPGPEHSLFGPTVQHLGVSLSPRMRLHHLYEHFPAAHRVARRSRRMHIITAAAMVMDRGLFLDVGGFDEDFRNGLEDVELCKRLHERQHTQLGRPAGLACVPQAVVWHLCGQSPGRNAAEEHNRAMLAQKGGHSFFYPDEHRFLEQDGYELRLTPWLDWQPSLPARQESQLQRSFKQMESQQELAAALVDEPLWSQGWSMLIPMQPSPTAALALALQAEKFDTTPAPLLHIRHYASLAGQIELAAQAQHSLERYLMPREERLRQLRRLRTALRSLCPELVPETDRTLREEDVFYREVYLAFERQTLYPS